MSKFMDITEEQIEEIAEEVEEEEKVAEAQLKEHPLTNILKNKL